MTQRPAALSGRRPRPGARRPADAAAASLPVHDGTFLLDGTTPYPTILGNSGPASYPPADMDAALAAG